MGRGSGLEVRVELGSRVEGGRGVSSIKWGNKELKIILLGFCGGSGISIYLNSC